MQDLMIVINFHHSITGQVLQWFPKVQDTESRWKEEVPGADLADVSSRLTARQLAAGPGVLPAFCGTRWPI